jgi:hypothetical protein
MAWSTSHAGTIIAADFTSEAVAAGIRVAVFEGILGSGICICVSNCSREVICIPLVPVEDPLTALVLGAREALAQEDCHILRLQSL